MTNALPTPLSVITPATRLGTGIISVHNGVFLNVFFKKYVIVFLLFKQYLEFSWVARFLVSNGDIQPAIRFAKQPEGHFEWKVLLDHRRLDVVASGYFERTNAGCFG